jgi:hypothetical protein
MNDDAPAFDPHFLALKIIVILLIAIFMLGVFWIAFYGRESKAPGVAYVSNMILDFIEKFGRG